MTKATKETKTKTISEGASTEGFQKMETNGKSFSCSKEKKSISVQKEPNWKPLSSTTELLSSTTEQRLKLTSATQK
jgi:hypothetical protein